MNCGIITVVMGIILSIMGNFLSTAQKHNRKNFAHNRPGPTREVITTFSQKWWILMVWKMRSQCPTVWHNKIFHTFFPKRMASPNCLSTHCIPRLFTVTWTTLLQPYNRSTGFHLGDSISKDYYDFAQLANSILEISTLLLNEHHSLKINWEIQHPS